MVWYGMVWYGMVWYGMVWYGMVWYGMVWYGMVWYGMVWYGMVWPGMADVCEGHTYIAEAHVPRRVHVALSARVPPFAARDGLQPQPYIKRGQTFNSEFETCFTPSKTHLKSRLLAPFFNP